MIDVNSLWWSLPAAILMSLAGVAILDAARIGLLQHRTPRVHLGVVVSMLAATYWLDILGVSPTLTAAARRVISYGLAVALIWVARSGVAFWRRESAALESMREQLDGDPWSG